MAHTIFNAQGRSLKTTTDHSQATSKFVSLNLPELAQIAVALQSLVGAQLQECLQSGSELGLGFYHDQEILWLWFDLNPQRPVVVRIRHKPPLRKKQMRPLTLFIRSRFLGRRLKSVRTDLARGRVLILTFHRSQSEGAIDAPEIEAILVPHAPNMTARDGRSVVSENKPKELPPPPVVDLSQANVRSWEQIEQEWENLQNSNLAAPSQAPTDAMTREKRWSKALEKKEAALMRMSEELGLKMSGIHREVGQWLKSNGDQNGLPLDIPAAYTDHIDLDKNLAWNIEENFRKAKENERKAEGTKTRIALVTQELEALKASGPKKFDTSAQEKRVSDSLLNKAAAKGRRHSLASDLDVYVGKSAADNLLLLRRAQPFDLWLHLRDQPGSHAIVRRTRGRNVTDQELTDAGTWLIEQSLGKRARELSGEKFELLIVECRYVKPIKGDKLGRVNYTNDRVMVIRF